MRLASIALLLTCLVLPAAAQDSPLSGTWIDSVSRSGPDAPEPWGAVRQVTYVNIGPYAVVLEETMLGEIAAALGTQVQRWGEAGEAVSWACLARGAETLWLYSDGEMGGGTVTGVGYDVRDAAPASAQCGAWPAELALDLGIMHVGLPTDAIIPNYQTGEPDEYGWFRATTLTPSAKDPAFQTWQELTFRQNDDRTINAVAVLQMTGD